MAIIAILDRDIYASVHNVMYMHVETLLDRTMQPKNRMPAHARLVMSDIDTKLCQRSGTFEKHMVSVERLHDLHYIIKGSTTTGSEIWHEINEIPLC